jgi:radical SAM superfamily enzyme YgiQ (UPF0313 family)
VLAELEAMRALGLEIVFVVDDNLIGNKRAVKELLRAVSVWQEANGYPLVLFTEASLDLADDDELLRLMVAANFFSVFIGIESPNEASLRETKKFQNVRARRTMVDRVHAIQRAGLEVWCGMILGFDHDGPDIFGAQHTFLRAARISMAMVGMLHAVPKTPLHARLAAEGRLDPADVPEYGTNVVPLRLTPRELCDGYVRLLDELYEPGAYFDRLDDLYLRQWYVPALTRERYWRRHPWQRVKAKARFLLRAAGLFARLMRHVPDPALRREYRRRIWGLWRARLDPGLLEIYVIKCAIHFHHHTMARQMAEGRGPFRNSF